MRALVAEHEVDHVAVARALLLALLALAAARLSLVTTNLAVSAVAASFGRRSTVDHVDGREGCRASVYNDRSRQTMF